VQAQPYLSSAASAATAGSPAASIAPMNCSKLAPRAAGITSVSRADAALTPPEAPTEEEGEGRGGGSQRYGWRGWPEGGVGRASAMREHSSKQGKGAAGGRSRDRDCSAGSARHEVREGSREARGGKTSLWLLLAACLLCSSSPADPCF